MDKIFAAGSSLNVDPTILICRHHQWQVQEVRQNIPADLFTHTWPNMVKLTAHLQLAYFYHVWFGAAGGVERVWFGAAHSKVPALNQIEACSNSGLVGQMMHTSMCRRQTDATTTTDTPSCLLLPAG